MAYQLNVAITQPGAIAALNAIFASQRLYMAARSSMYQRIALTASMYVCGVSTTVS